MDTSMGYSVLYPGGGTSFMVNTQKKQFTISQIFGKRRRNTIVPTISMKTREFGLSYHRHLSAGGTVEATWKPDKSIAIQWLDGDWVAAIRTRLDEGLWEASNKVKFSMKRSVGVSLF